MVVLVIVLLLLIVGIVGYLAGQSGRQESSPPARDPETELQTAIELHRIRCSLDASWTKTQQRQEATQLRRQIAEAFEEEDEG
jgi:hypothetical protein